MLGSAIFDVLLAVIFIFLGISLAASALTEAISSFLKLRQSTLKAGVQAFLNDEKFTGLAKELYSHALVNPLLNNKDLAIQPAYIDAQQFTVALIDILRRAAPVESSIEEVLSKITDPALKQGLQALYESAGKDLTRFKTAVGSWFDASMDRLAGWYKRRTQVIPFCVALFCAALLNADALRVATLVWKRPTLADGVTVGGQQHVSIGLDAALKILDTGSLIGWDCVARVER